MSNLKHEPNVEHDPRWEAVLNRDARLDGDFYFSVKSTGVYCHPSCPARRPNPQNVAFHETTQGAEAAGFRPCKRCQPDQGSLRERQLAIVQQACRTIEEAQEPPSLDNLAEAAGISTYHFHRIFKASTGVTPKSYAEAQRAERVKQALSAKESSVTDALYEAGFNSSGRFYEAAPNLLGMKPKAYQKGGLNSRIHFAVAPSSLGSILVARSEQGICAILLGDDPTELVRDLQSRFSKAELIQGDSGFEEIVSQVVQFVEHPQAGLDLPLDVRGTAFQQRVWEVLRRIPVGETRSYADVANALGAPTATRAVAGACAANALAVAIPCHRVVKSDGDISGYRWGVERKRELLSREREQS